MAKLLKHTKVSAKDDGVDATLVRPSDWNAGHEGLEVIVKTADETVNNSETLQDDDHLVLAVGANDVWLIRILLKVISASVTPDIDFLFTVPAGGAFHEYREATLGAGASLTPWDITVERTIPIIAAAKYYFSWALYVGGGTAGNLRLQWAQHTATVEDTKILANSFILAMRIK